MRSSIYGGKKHSRREEAFKEGKALKRENASATKGTQKDKYKSERYPWITTD